MRTQKDNRSLQAATAMPLTVPLPPDAASAREDLLAVLFNLGMEGNVSAIKLYLDHSLKTIPGSGEGFSAEEALRLLANPPAQDGA